MTTESLVTAETSEGRKAKSSFWTLKRGKQDDAAVHPPFRPTLPHVNLLPAPIKDAIRAGKLRRWFILGGLLIAAVVAGIWYLQGSQISKAEETLAQAQTQNAQLNARLGALAGVKEMYGQITRLQDVVDTTMASQPISSLVLTQLFAAASAAGGGSKDVTFSAASVNYTGIPRDATQLNSCPNPDPFNSEPTIGCVTFTATAVSREQVSELLRVLEADPLFTGPFVTSTSITPGNAAAGSKDSVVFSGTVGVALEALETKLTPEQIQALLTPAAPAASPSPEATS